MERNKEINRDILLYLSNHEQTAVDEIVLDQYSPEITSYHIELLIEERCLTGINLTSPADPYPTWQDIKLTALGHDYVDVIKDDKTWESIKQQKREAIRQMLVYGDLIIGDKAAGDKVDGNKML